MEKAEGIGGPVSISTGYQTETTPVQDSSCYSEFIDGPDTDGDHLVADNKVNGRNYHSATETKSLDEVLESNPNPYFEHEGEEVSEKSYGVLSENQHNSSSIDEILWEVPLDQSFCENFPNENQNSCISEFSSIFNSSLFGQSVPLSFIENNEIDQRLVAIQNRLQFVGHVRVTKSFIDIFIHVYSIQYIHSIISKFQMF